MQGIEELPNKDILIGILKKTIEKSWKIDMEIDYISDWLSNFTGEMFDSEEEKQLALWLLCNFTFYNEDDVRHLCKSLYNIFFHRVLLDFSVSTEGEMKDIISRIKYSAIGRASESGNYLLYDFRQEAGLNIKKFFYPTSLVSDNDTIVAFIDDVILTGGTAISFLKENLQGFQAKKIYYISLFATEEAIERLKKNGIEVVYCTLLNERNKCFSTKSMIFSKYPDLLEPTQKLAQHYGAKLIKKHPLGHGNSQFCFGFYYNTPNNSLPIFWSNSCGWKPIFERRGKKRNGGWDNKQYI